jgi:hypothetical protein
MIEIAIYIYLGIAGISLIATVIWMMDYGIEGIDGFWDWIIYNLFWIILPVKSIIKLFKNL